MSAEIRKQFCLHCSGRIKPDDIGAVELEQRAGGQTICGGDVDKLIAGIYVKSDPVPLDTAPRLPGEPK